MTQYKQTLSRANGENNCHGSQPITIEVHNDFPTADKTSIRGEYCVVELKLFAGNS